MFWFLVSFVIWALVHSLTAGSSAKRVFRERFGERAYDGLYRLLYNVLSLISFLPVLYVLWTQIPQVALWTIPTPWRYLTMGIQLLALAGLALSLWQTDVWAFAGVRQALRYMRGSAEPQLPDQLVVSGTYSWVRHPLYFFSLLIIWLNPDMTLASLLFNILATLYFGIGSIYEERRLLRAFGQTYEEYQQTVPMLFPFHLPGHHNP
jgi:protein-S-isoprenylcysteine O-methyltransferase Ste14